MKDETSLDFEIGSELCNGDEVVAAKLVPAASDVGIVSLVEEVVKGAATEAGCRDEDV